MDFHALQPCHQFVYLESPMFVGGGVLGEPACTPPVCLSLMLIEAMNYGAVAQGGLVSTTGGQLGPVLRSKGQMCTAVSGAPSRMGPMFRSAPQAVHTVVPEQAAVPICVPEQCMLVLSVAGTWRSDWRHVLASMANTKHTAPVGRPALQPTNCLLWLLCRFLLPTLT